MALSEEEAYLTSLQQHAAQTHEMYVAYVEAGFSAEQALRLVLTHLVTIVQNGES